MSRTVTVSISSFAWDSNSGEVIAGEIGSGAGSYTAIGEQVGWPSGWNRRHHPEGCCSVNPPRGWSMKRWSSMNPELVRIKGAEQPVPARRLLGVAEHGAISRRDTIWLAASGSWPH